MKNPFKSFLKWWNASPYPRTEALLKKMAEAETEEGKRAEQKRRRKDWVFIEMRHLLFDIQNDANLDIGDSEIDKRITDALRKSREFI